MMTEGRRERTCTRGGERRIYAGAKPVAYIQDAKRIYAWAVSQHNIRIEQELWDRALAKARGEARTLTDVIAEALCGYAPPERRPVPTNDGKPAIEGAEEWDREPVLALKPRPDTVSLADALKASLTAQREPVATILTETVHCPHDGERVHGPGAGWYCGECGTNLTAPAGESTPQPSGKPCKHPRALRGWCNDCKTGGHY
jgi:hypothetical protein